jgi:hypothetical protein
MAGRVVGLVPHAFTPPVRATATGMPQNLLDRSPFESDLDAAWRRGMASLEPAREKS